MTLDEALDLYSEVCELEQRGTLGEGKLRTYARKTRGTDAGLTLVLISHEVYKTIADYFMAVYVRPFCSILTQNSKSGRLE